MNDKCKKINTHQPTQNFQTLNDEGTCRRNQTMNSLLSKAAATPDKCRSRRKNKQRGEQLAEKRNRLR